MQLTVTSGAERILKKLNEKNHQYLILWYDTEGCGCGVNGMPAVRFSNEKMKNYLDVENDFLPTFVHKQQASFFAENMKLDFSHGTFRLSGPEGILNPFISQQSVCALE